ncbi:MAG TPA: deoxyribodipyrimidine photo-lyase [Gaiellaceae bacterium]
MRADVVLFTRDLRVHDHPALAAAADRSDRVLPLFVLDDRVLATFGAPNRMRFLAQSLADLDAALRERGSALVVRRGNVVVETVRAAVEVGAELVHVSEDVSSYAQERERRLAAALAGTRTGLALHPGVSVVAPDDLAPAGAEHYSVFTPYWRRWREQPRRALVAPPHRLVLPDGIDPGLLPPAAATGTAPDLPVGGERAGRRRLFDWLDEGLPHYHERANDLGADATSRLSPYVHFGCVSPTEVAALGLERGGDAFVRQLAWRDFNNQLLRARPELARDDLRRRDGSWGADEDALAAWREGRTGVPLVDAAMRQLLREGWMHNRARLVVGSFLTKHLGLDWRHGAAHFSAHLVDGDVANNALNWQWVAGTGADTRPYRKLSPQRQAERHDAEGIYVRRYLREAE